MQSFKQHLAERALTDAEQAKKETIVKSLKKDKSLSDDSKHAIATAKAKETA